MAKKSGGENTRDDKYIRKILLENEKIYKYEVPLIIKAFKLTIKHFFDELIEFKINDFIDFVRFTKKDANIYIRYRDEYSLIPEHDDMKIKVSKNLKDYLNKRNSYKDSRHREVLPDDIRNKKIF